MRLGCEVTASDINPVAWFILRCTLHYPHLMVGKTRPLPDFALRERDFVEAFLKTRGIKRKSDLRSQLVRLGLGDGEPEQLTSFDVGPPEASADFSLASPRWGRRVLAGARRELASRYPVYAEFEAGQTQRPPWKAVIATETLQGGVRQCCWNRTRGDQMFVQGINAEFDSFYLEDPRNPRWVGQTDGGVPVGAHR